MSNAFFRLACSWLSITCNLFLILSGFILIGLGYSLSENWVHIYDQHSNSPLLICFGLAVSILGSVVILFYIFSDIWKSTDEKSTCAKITFITLFVVSICLVILCCLIIAMSVKQHHDVRKNFEVAFKNEIDDFLRSNLSSGSLQMAQTTLKCCGWNGPEDYYLVHDKQKHLPSSCCGDTETWKERPMTVCKAYQIQFELGCSRLEHLDFFDPIHVVLGVILALLLFATISQASLCHFISKNDHNVTCAEKCQRKTCSNTCSERQCA